MKLILFNFDKIKDKITTNRQTVCGHSIHTGPFITKMAKLTSKQSETYLPFCSLVNLVHFLFRFQLNFNGGLNMRDNVR